jgi:hypothetical protein
MLRVLFFTPISLCLASRLHSVGGEPVTGAGLGDKYRIPLTRSDEVFGAVLDE